MTYCVTTSVLLPLNHPLCSIFCALYKMIVWRKQKTVFLDILEMNLTNWIFLNLVLSFHQVLNIKQKRNHASED